MTNTRITDVEIFERRYPVIVRRFALRPNSGGKGKFKGGDGVIREIEFRSPVKVSLLTERRSMAPYGLEGGEPGERGVNLFTRKADGVTVNVGGKCLLSAERGDLLTLLTPGGGGYGWPDV